MEFWHGADEERKSKTRKAQRAPAEPAKEAGAGRSNKAVQKVVPGLHLQLKGAGGVALDETIARAIHAKRGSGEPLDKSAGDKIGKALGDDFSDVNIHRDQQADTLNKQVKAEAFTTGKDIFFREGKYDPVSGEGQKLLAHELTHVTQQRNSTPSSELKVSDPHEASEQQAKSTAEKVSSPAASAGPSSVGREVDDEEAAASLARDHNPEEEEDKKMHMSVERQAPDEEEAAASVARQAPDEEEAAASVARQAPDEEEAAAMLARQEEPGTAPEEEEEAAATLARQEDSGEEEKEE